MAVDVLDDDDRVVDEDADREDEREQRHAVEREAPGPGGEQRDRQREDHGAADDRRLAPAERQEHERDHGGGGEQELFDQLGGLVVCGRAVVARFGDLDAVRDERVAQHRDARHHAVGDADRVLALLLRDGERDGRKFAAIAAGDAMPDIALGRQRTVGDGCHVLQEHRLAVAHGNDQLADVSRVAQVRTRLERQRTVARQQIADGRAEVGREQGLAQLGDGHARAGHAPRVDLDANGASRSADRGDLARAGHALEIGFEGVRHALQVERAGRRVARIERQGDDGNVGDALGLDDRLTDPQPARQPVGVAVDRVVEANECLGARHAHLELHRHHGEAGARDARHVLGAADLRQHLLGGRRHHLLDVAHRRAGKGDDDVGHRHVDLRLLLARRDEDRERAEQERHQRQQRRDLRALEEAGDAAGDAQRAVVHGAIREGMRAAACGSRATRSLAETPASTSTCSPLARPRRTWRSNGTPSAPMT